MMMTRKNADFMTFLRYGWETCIFMPHPYL